MRSYVRVVVSPQPADAFEAVHGFPPGRGQVLRRRAEAFARTGDFAAATKALTEAADADAENIEADRVEAARAFVEHRRRTAERIARLRSRIEANPSDAAARTELVMLAATEMDDPPAAAKHLAEAVEEALRKHVSLAAGLREGPDEEWLALAAWYRQLAASAAAPAKPGLLRRVQQCYRLLAAKGEPGRPGQDKLTADLEKVDADLAELQAAVGGWTDLLPRAKAGHVETGKWSRKGKGYVLSASSFGVLTLPVVLDGSYILRLDFLRTEGSDGIFVALPVGSGRCNLNLSGWDGAASGLEWIDDREANANESTLRPGKIENARPHRLIVRVEVKQGEVSVTTSLDGKPYVKWAGKISRLKPAQAWKLGPAGTPAIGAHMSAVEFRSAKLKMLAGKAKPLD